MGPRPEEEGAAVRAPPPRLKRKASPGAPDARATTPHDHRHGYRFEHSAQNLRGGYLGPLPDFARDTTARLVARGLMPYEPDQMIINHYNPGQGIHPHVDKTHCFEGVVASLALGSSCIMKFECVSPSLSAPSLAQDRRLTPPSRGTGTLERGSGSTSSSSDGLR